MLKHICLHFWFNTLGLITEIGAIYVVKWKKNNTSTPMDTSLEHDDNMITPTHAAA